MLKKHEDDEHKNGNKEMRKNNARKTILLVMESCNVLD